MKSASKNNGFIITKIDPSTLDWNRTQKYLPVCKAVSQLKIGEAISVAGIERQSACSSIRSWSYKNVKGVYRIRTQYKKENQVAVFWKTAK